MTRAWGILDEVLGPVYTYGDIFTFPNFSFRIQLPDFGNITYSKSYKRIIDNYALRQTTNAIMLLPCNEWTEQLLNITISSCSKSEVGMAKNSGFV